MESAVEEDESADSLQKETLVVIFPSATTLSSGCRPAAQNPLTMSLSHLY